MNLNSQLFFFIPDFYSGLEIVIYVPIWVYPEELKQDLMHLIVVSRFQFNWNIFAHLKKLKIFLKNFNIFRELQTLSIL